ncbi:MAG: hypothetical protein C0399_04850 [Syntrophus sp. (in: bacteria)]|nr:hypothetical protein [Syntrophus sp. (in: bacteria)]
MFLSILSISFFSMFFCNPMSATAGDEPFITPANSGFTGIMELPTARMLKENSYRVGVSQIDPYRYYYLALSPFKGVELSGKVTEILGVAASPGDPKWSGYGNDKDKSFGVRFRIMEESKWKPAVAVDIMDPQGTRVYASQSIVASKQLYPFDFTVGFGNGRFGKGPLSSSEESFKAELFNDPKSWLKDGQFFWGIQLALSEKYALMLEYNPIRYEKQTSDPARNKYFADAPPSPFNIGIRWKPFKWTEIDVSYQRGNQIGVNFSAAFDIGQPIISIYNQPYREKKEDAANPLYQRLVTALQKSGFRSIGIMIDRNDLWIRAKNDRYYYNTKAIGVIARIIAEIVPLHFQTIHIALTENEIPLFEFTTTRYDIAEWYAERLTPGEFFFLSKTETAICEMPDMKLEYKSLFGYGMRPVFQTFLNDPSGFFKYRLGAEGWISHYPWKGMSFIVGFAGYPLNNISTVNSPSEDAIRSDIPLYKEKNLALSRLMFDQLYKMEHETYGRFSGGLLEIEYAGLDGEIARPINKGRFLVGLSGSIVKKRDPDSAFGLKDGISGKTYHTWFLNARLNIPEIDVFVDIKTGRFLGGDEGAKLTVSKFIKGVIIYGWYSATDTSGFRDSFNRGYHDKGIGVTIPLMIFKGADSRTVYNYSISPWTRDVAQDIDHHNTIFGFLGRTLKLLLDRDKGLLYK